MAKNNVSEIDSMSVMDIIDEIGLNITSPYEAATYIFDQDVPYGEIKEAFEKTDAQYRAIQENFIFNQVREQEYARISRGNPLADLIIKYQDKINKKNMVLITLYNTQELIERVAKDPNEKQNLTQWREAVSRAIRLIGNENITIADIDFDNDFPKVHVINSVEVIKCIKDRKSLDTLTDEPSRKKQTRFEKIKEETSLENVIGVLFAQDVEGTICTDEECGKQILAIIAYVAMDEYKKAHPDYKENYENDDEIFEIISHSPQYNETMIRVLQENLKYVDIDKMLLVLAHNMLLAMEAEEMPELKIGEVQYINEVLRKMLQNINKKTQIELLYGEELKTYTPADLKRNLERFRKNGYIRLKDMEELKEKLMANETTMLESDIDVLDCMEFTEEEIKILAANSEKNVIFLMNIGIINMQNLGEYVGEIKTYSEGLFKAMITNQLLTYEDTKKMLENGKIKPEYISKIENVELINNINDEAKNQIRELCIKITGQKVSPEDMRRFNLYVLIYKSINISEKSDEEIKKASNELIEGLEENLSEEILKELYQYGVLDLETAVDWGMDIEPMILNNTLKPVDFKDLYMKGIITKERIKAILKGKTLSYEEKIDLIYGTFDGESEEEIKLVDELLEVLGIQKDSLHEENGKSGKTGKKGITEKKKQVNKYIVDAHTRWTIISLGDKDYSKNFLPKNKTIMDGHRVFLLPNRDEVIIEKMHQKTKEGKKDAYGYATYIMSSDAFYANIDEIITDGQVNRTFLRELEEDGQALKLNHDRSWGDNLKEHFEIDESQPELNDKMDNAIKRYRACKERKQD